MLEKFLIAAAPRKFLIKLKLLEVELLFFFTFRKLTSFLWIQQNFKDVWINFCIVDHFYGFTSSQSESVERGASPWNILEILNFLHDCVFTACLIHSRKKVSLNTFWMQILNRWSLIFIKKFCDFQENSGKIHRFIEAQTLKKINFSSFHF